MIIKIKENKFGLLIHQMLIKEDSTNYPIFGSGSHAVNYKPYIDSINKIQNLHTDRYKDYELEEAWNDWKNTGFDKNSQEYFIYLSKFKNFMFMGAEDGGNGFLRNVSYVADRINGPFHTFILDPKWIASLNSNPNYKYSYLNSNKIGDEWQCFYTTVLKLYQNPAIWNDFFFNPVFKEYAQKFFRARDRLSDLFKKNPEEYKATYSKILPIKEYAELNKFVGIIDKIYDEAKKNVVGWEIRDRKNQKEDLFYNPPQNDGNEDEEDY